MGRFENIIKIPSFILVMTMPQGFFFKKKVWLSSVDQIQMMINYLK